ncbi:cyclopropane-fatty-acyl-phospholipid synthase family protein [Paraburkholderia sp. MM5384-R2]|uniref:SAM-dependent methyltransferase n=1 Tax=Paraburkholderia sp. MM5384-R2 TaxID=2723097 RepID=UPI0017C2D550|nr:class I SAM-dependent methyltransferase [Paraburkholderia sp. MM5384-R2]MBB5496882.1 2-polyprenyl-3-methyl-5-hydroxy-6-metoxy-1,4-benzoquinol methylase [Paraburkholderia sp. MM5384-R2]
MRTVRSALAGIINGAKTIPILGAAQLALYERYWRKRTAREWSARYVGAQLVVDGSGSPEPTLHHPTSQFCTASQCVEERYRYWCREMKSPARLARKQWEFVYTLEALAQSGMLVPGKHGLGFGCGGEPLSAVMAKHGATIVATDLYTAEAIEKGWATTQQHASTLAALNSYGICDARRFTRLVSFEFADMNAIPAKFADAFDFVWSCCAFEHLGSIRHGLDFVRNAARCLKPGGVAVHTTEFNLSSNDATLEDPGCVIFRKRDMELLHSELEADGYHVAPFNFNPGSKPIDRHIDAPPYAASPHLKLRLKGYVATSFGLVIHKP